MAERTPLTYEECYLYFAPAMFDDMQNGDTNDFGDNTRQVFDAIQERDHFNENWPIIGKARSAAFTAMTLSHVELVDAVNEIFVDTPESIVDLYAECLLATQAQHVGRQDDPINGLRKNLREIGISEIELHHISDRANQLLKSQGKGVTS